MTGVWGIVANHDCPGALHVPLPRLFSVLQLCGHQRQSLEQV